MSRDVPVPPLPSNEHAQGSRSDAPRDNNRQHYMDETAEWPCPAELPDDLPPVPTLAPELLPDSHREWIVDVADRMQAPLEYPAVALMVALGVVVGRQVGIRPKRHDIWTVVPNLWGAVVGRPGTLKSPALSEALAPLRRLEARARESYEAEQHDYEAQRMIEKANSKEVEKAIHKAIHEGDHKKADLLASGHINGGAEPPVRRRYMTNDATVEKLGELLSRNPRGILLYRDELVGFLRNLDREGREGERSFFLEAWNGDGRFTFDRIGRGTIEIESCCASVLGGIQPGPLSEYLRSAMAGGGGDDGLLQRFQLAVWPDVPASWQEVDRPPDKGAWQRASVSFDSLDSLDLEKIGASAESGIPFLRFDQKAQEEFGRWRADLEGRLRTDSEHPAFIAHLAKFRSLVPSLALLIHLAGDGIGPVGIPSLLAAIGWAEFLEEHARRLYVPALAPDLAAARELHRHIGRGDVKSPFRARDVYRKGWRLLDQKGTCRALEYLEGLDLVRGQRVDTGGHPRTDWYINPKIAHS